MKLGSRFINFEDNVNSTLSPAPFLRLLFNLDPSVSLHHLEMRNTGKDIFVSVVLNNSKLQEADHVFKQLNI